MDTLAAGALLRDVARLHIQSQREQVACCGGTTATQCQILTELGQYGPMTLAELSHRVGLDKSWTSRAVDVLVEAGLLIKEAGAPDRRTIRITFSPTGMARYTDLKDTLNAQAERVLGRIPANEQANVYHALKLLQEALRAEAAGTNEQPNEREHQA